MISSGPGTGPNNDDEPSESISRIIGDIETSEQFYAAGLTERPAFRPFALHTPGFDQAEFYLSPSEYALTFLGSSPFNHFTYPKYSPELDTVVDGEMVVSPGQIAVGLSDEGEIRMIQFCSLTPFLRTLQSRQLVTSRLDTDTLAFLLEGYDRLCAPALSPAHSLLLQRIKSVVQTHRGEGDLNLPTVRKIIE